MRKAGARPHKATLNISTKEQFRPRVNGPFGGIENILRKDVRKDRASIMLPDTVLLLFD